MQTKRCWAGVCWEVQLWSSVLGAASLGGSPREHRQPEWGRDDAIPDHSWSALPCCHRSLAQGKEAEGNAAQAAPGVRWVVICAWPCKNTSTS